MMHPADAGGNALKLGRDVLALARRALEVDDATSAEEVRWAIEHAAAALRMAVAERVVQAQAVQEVLDGLADVLAGLGARSGSAGAEKPDRATQ